MALDYKLMTTRPPPAEKKLKNANGSASSKSDKFESLLHKIKWRRVVLDEGHVIKNRATLMSLACAALIAESVLPSHTFTVTDRASQTSLDLDWNAHRQFCFRL